MSCRKNVCFPLGVRKTIDSECQQRLLIRLKPLRRKIFWLKIGHWTIPQNGGNPTQVNDAISLPRSQRRRRRVGVGSLAYYTHYASSTLLFSSSIKTFAASLPSSFLSALSLSHSMGRSRMWVRVERSVKECRDPEEAGAGSNIGRHLQPWKDACFMAR